MENQKDKIDPPIEADASFDRLVPRESEERRSTAQVLRRYASVLAIVGVVGMAVAGSFLLGGEDPLPAPASRAPQPPTMPATQRDNELSPEFRRQVQQADAQRAEEALRQGGSALPTPIFQGVQRQPPPPVQAPSPPQPEPPALPPRVEAPIPPPVLPVQAVPVQQAQPARQPMTQQDMQNMLQAMQRQAEQAALRNLTAATTIFFERANEETQPQFEQQSTTSAQNQRTTLPSQGQNGILPPPGTILYARLLGRANSDNPGPILAEILQGDFAGARVLGQFQTGRDGLLMQFKTMTLPARNGRQSQVIDIDAIAVDPENLGSSLATSVNRRELQRIAMAFGTAFMRGLGQAIGQSGAVISQGIGGVVVQNPVLDTRRQLLVGAGTAAGAAGEVFQEIYGNRPPTIIVEAGTLFGILFLGSP